MRDALNELARRRAPRGFDEVLAGAAASAERDAAARDAGGDDLDTIPFVTSEPVARRQSLSSMIAAAGLSWRVEQHPLEAVVEREQQSRRVPVPRHVANVRSDTRASYPRVKKKQLQPKWFRSQVLSRGKCGGVAGGVESLEEAVEVVAGERPLERLRDLAVVLVEVEQPFGERVERVEVVGG